MCFRVKSCCCGCSSLEQGTVAIAVIGLFFACLGTVYATYYTVAVGSLPDYMSSFPGHEKGIGGGGEGEIDFMKYYKPPPPGVGIIYNLPAIIIDGLLLYGALKRKPGFMLPWLIITMIGIVIMALFIVAVVVFIIMALVYGATPIAIFLIIFLVIMLPIEALYLYLFHVVYSYSKEIQEEGNIQGHVQFQAIPMQQGPPPRQQPPAYAHKV